MLGLLAAMPLLPAAASNGELPDLGPSVRVSHLSAGGELIVRPAAGAPVAAVELWYRAPSTGFGANPTPSLARVAAQAVAASKPLVGEALGASVAAVGGRLTITVYGDSISVSAVVPATSARAIVKAMTRSFFAPVVTSEGFRAAQRDVAQEALLSSFDPETVVRDALFAELFSDGPQHFPALGNPREVGAISLGDVKAFAERAFRSQNAVLVVSGAVDRSVADAATTGRPAGDDSSAEAPATPGVASSLTPIRKSFGQPSAGYGWIGPPISSEREATAMDFVSDYLFRPESGYVTQRVATAYPDAFLAGQFVTLHDPGVLYVAYSGRQLAGLTALVDDGVARVQQPLDAASFTAALAAFKYHMLSDLQTPSQMADVLGWYTVEGAPQYAPGANGDEGAYFKALSSLTAEYVADVARRYLGKPAATATFDSTPAPAGPGSRKAS
jgi:predicted Zn-dependent peptidase